MKPLLTALALVFASASLASSQTPAAKPSAAKAPAASAPDLATLRKSFQSPPDDARIMMRWWWFGPGVQKPELAREMRAMKQGGIGGFEVQPVYPLALDDTAKNFRNLPYLSDGFLDDLRFANTTAHTLGLRVDLTLASGWPYGGSYVPVDHASSRLRIVRTAIPEGATSIAAPDMGNGESLVAVFLANGANTGAANGAKTDTASGANTKDMRPLPMFTGLRMAVPSGLTGPHTAVFFITSRTGQMVKRAAVGADGFVLDHLDRTAVETHLSTVGDRLLTAFGNQPPYAVFSDSLEVYGADWTPDFLAQFQKRRGYDLTPYLPALIGPPPPRRPRVSAAMSVQPSGPRPEPVAEKVDEQTANIRHDYGVTLTDLMDDNYLTPVNEWAKAHHTLFRSQTYGQPAVNMASNALVALPEGEGAQWRSFSFTRWATSASHLYHRPVTSAETWTWLHSPAFRAVPLDMKAEADLFFLEGVNQIIGHGWPYTPADVPEPGWAFYAAAVFNDHNPWYIAMPSVAKYLQRSSYMLRQGEPANDVALLLPDDDAWSHFTTAHDSISEMMPMLLGSEVTPQILDAGFNLDYIDATALDAAGIQHKVLVLPGVEQMPLATYRKIAAFAKNGGILVATRRLPSRAPGFKTQQADSDAVKELSHELFEAPNAPGHLVTDETQLGATLDKLLQPDMKLSTPTPEIGFIHRKLPNEDIYFVVNTSNQRHQFNATFGANRTTAQVWDATTGKAERAVSAKSIALNLAPYDSRFIILSNGTIPAEPATPAATAPEPLDIASGWSVTIPASPTSHAETIQMAHLHSWTDDDATRYFSGRATYTKTINVPAEFLKPGLETDIDFGPGTPIDPSHEKPGTRPYAYIASPVREVAEVYVNGKDAGSVWAPPYVANVSGLLHAGSNEIRIVVGNTDMNTLAGRSLPNYSLLNSRYTERATPQDQQLIAPLPSGMLGPVKLTAHAQQ